MTIAAYEQVRIMYQALTERVGFIPGGVNIGVIRIDERRVLIVDSGLNDSTARKVLRWITEALDSDVVGILTTHGHADHFGAHAFVVKRTGADVWAPRYDADVIRNPMLSPIFLYGGADPLDTLRGRFLLAEPCRVDTEFDAGTISPLGVDIEAVGYPGHSPNQMGFLVDGVLFCADVVFPEAAIEKYRIPYLFGLTDHLASLETFRATRASVIVPGHGPIEDDPEGPYTRNREAIERTIDAILDVLAEPTSAEAVAAATFTRLDVPIGDHAAYYLLRPTIAAYLSHLHRAGAARMDIEGGFPMWRRT
jgi:glyoxylase-like metal-dependent hydrolase (beta-lactamase superfamily II)